MVDPLISTTTISESPRHCNRREQNLGAQKIHSQTMGPHGLSEDEVADLKEAFSMVDTDGGGT